MKQSGPIDAAAAIFIFKCLSDRAGDAWMSSSEVDRTDKGVNMTLNPTEKPAGSPVPSTNNESAIRRERHENASVFLSELKKWNTSCARSQFLMIVAHGVASPATGLSPTTAHRNDIVTWQNLADALPNGVDFLVLVGCETIGACQAFAPLTGPIRSAMIVTTTSKEWGHLVESFKHIICMGGETFTFNDQLPDLIANRFDSEAKVFWVRDGNWSPT